MVGVILGALMPTGCAAQGYRIGATYEHPKYGKIGVEWGGDVYLKRDVMRDVIERLAKEDTQDRSLSAEQKRQLLTDKLLQVVSESEKREEK